MFGLTTKKEFLKLKKEVGLNECLQKTLMKMCVGLEFKIQKIESTLIDLKEIRVCLNKLLGELPCVKIANSASAN